MSGLFVKFRIAVRRFAVTRKGATAVEFAMIAPWFFLLIFGIIELGMVYMVSTSLDNALTYAARRVRTGEQTMQNGATQTSMKNAICDSLGWMQSSCKANLYLDVRVFGSYANASAAATPLSVNDNGTPTKKDDDFLNTTLKFCTGDPGEIVMVRAYYQWKLFTPGINKALVKVGNDRMLISSATVFSNEPYEQAATAGCVKY